MQIPNNGSHTEMPDDDGGNDEKTNLLHHHLREQLAFNDGLHAPENEDKVEPLWNDLDEFLEDREMWEFWAIWEMMTLRLLQSGYQSWDFWNYKAIVGLMHSTINYIDLVSSSNMEGIAERIGVALDALREIIEGGDDS